MSSEPETWLGMASAALALLGALYRREVSMDRRLRAVELSLARIEASLGTDPRDSVITVSEPPSGEA